MTNTDLIARLDSEFGCWIAFKGDTPWDSPAIGEGSTREDAIRDYWYGIHGDNIADVIEPNHAEGEWKLMDSRGYYSRFETREEAVSYAEINQYLINPYVKKA